MQHEGRLFGDEINSVIVPEMSKDTDRKMVLTTLSAQSLLAWGKSVRGKAS